MEFLKRMDYECCVGMAERNLQLGTNHQITRNLRLVPVGPSAFRIETYRGVPVAYVAKWYDHIIVHPAGARVVRPVHLKILFGLRVVTSSGRRVWAPVDGPVPSELYSAHHDIRVYPHGLLRGTPAPARTMPDGIRAAWRAAQRGFKIQLAVRMRLGAFDDLLNSEILGVTSRYMPTSAQAREVMLCTVRQDFHEYVRLAAATQLSPFSRVKELDHYRLSVLKSYQLFSRNRAALLKDELMLWLDEDPTRIDAFIARKDVYSHG